MMTRMLIFDEGGDFENDNDVSVKGRCRCDSYICNNDDNDDDDNGNVKRCDSYI